MLTLTCPQCGQPIEADQINVQEMVAVCSTCNIVFRFAVPEQAQKRRKVQQPERLAVSEGDELRIAYRRILGREAKETLLGVGVASILFAIIFILVLGGILAGDVPLLVALIPLGFLSFFGYALSLILLNESRIVVDEEQLSVSQKPLPAPFEEEPSLDLSRIVRIGCEETEASRKAGSVNQDYMVFAELLDGNRVLIAKELPRTYAFYIAQMLEETLPTVEDLDDIILNLSEEDMEDSDDSGFPTFPDDTESAQMNH